MAQAYPATEPLSPASSSSATPTARRRTLIAASLGNGLEVFDFTAFSFFVVFIGQLYFPSDTPTAHC